MKLKRTDLDAALAAGAALYAQKERALVEDTKSTGHDPEVLFPLLLATFRSGQKTWMAAREALMNDTLEIEL